MLDCGTSLVADICQPTYTIYDVQEVWQTLYTTVFLSNHASTVETDYSPTTRTLYDETTLRSVETAFSPSISSFSFGSSSTPTSTATAESDFVPTVPAQPGSLFRDVKRSQETPPNSNSTFHIDPDKYRHNMRRSYDFNRCNFGLPSHDMVSDSLIEVCHFAVNVAAGGWLVSLRPTRAAYMPSWMGYVMRFVWSLNNLSAIQDLRKESSVHSHCY